MQGARLQPGGLRHLLLVLAPRLPQLVRHRLLLEALRRLLRQPLRGVQLTLGCLRDPARQQLTKTSERGECV